MVTIGNRRARRPSDSGSIQSTPFGGLGWRAGPAGWPQSAGGEASGAAAYAVARDPVPWRERGRSPVGAVEPVLADLDQGQVADDRHDQEHEERAGQRPEAQDVAERG